MFGYLRVVAITKNTHNLCLICPILTCYRVSDRHAHRLKSYNILVSKGEPKRSRPIRSANKNRSLSGGRFLLLKRGRDENGIASGSPRTLPQKEQVSWGRFSKSTFFFCNEANPSSPAIQRVGHYLTGFLYF